MKKTLSKLVKLIEEFPKALGAPDDSLESKICPHAKEIIKGFYECTLEKDEKCDTPYHPKNCGYLWYHKGEIEPDYKK